MTPSEFLTAVDIALAQAKATKRRKRDACLPLTAAVVLGEQGTYLDEVPGVGPRFTYTVEQCVRMRELILEAAREDAGL